MTSVGIIGAMIFLVSGCGLLEAQHAAGQRGPLGQVQVLDAGLDDRAHAILADRCVSCHGPSSPGQGNFSSAGDTARMAADGWIRIGDPDGSPLLQAVSSGAMPPGQPLRKDEVQALHDWLVSGVALGSVPTPVPFGFPPGTSDLTRRAVLLLDRRCAVCHNAAHGALTGGGILDMRDPARLVAAGLVVPGGSAVSPLFITVLNGRDGKAPFPPLAQTEIDLLQQWIDSDLKPDVKPLDGDTVAPLVPTYQSIRANIFATRCMACHPSYQTYTETLLSLVKGNAAGSELYVEVRAGRMPTNTRPLSSRELAILAAWINAGAPNN